MFGIGFFELVVIAVVALVFVGPKRLPEVMKQAGKFFVHMRRTANDVKGTFEGVMRDAEDEIRKEEVANMKQILAAQNAQIPHQTVQTTATALPDPNASVAHDPHAADAGLGHNPATPASGTGTDPKPS